MNEEETKKQGLWNKLPIKTKITIIGIAMGFFFIIIFIVVITTPLMELGIIDIGRGGPASDDDLDYSDIVTSNTYWWPIGSDTTERVGNILLAADTPAESIISSQFGIRNDPYTNKSTGHGGTDIAPIDGTYGKTNVIAAKNGVVIYPTEGAPRNCVSNTSSDPCGEGYGNYVMIEHNDGKVTLYGHMYENSITVKAGDTVVQGQVIGKVGSSGRSTGNHLHFEVRVNGTPVEPLNYVSMENPRPVIEDENVVEGNTNKQTVCLTLVNNNYSQNGVIALMANINAESSFNPTSEGDYENGVSTSYGLCQWHNERWDNLKNTFPDTYTQIGGQLSFLTYELKNSYSILYNNLISGTKSASDLTYDFCKEFEKPKDTETTCKNRANTTSTFSGYVKNNCN